MARPDTEGNALEALAGKTLWRYIWLVQRTSQWIPHLSTLEGRRLARKLTDEHPFVFAMWHGQFMLLPLLCSPQYPTEVMVARHGDAAIAAEMLKHFHMKLIRGAGSGGRRKDRGGAHAIRAAQEALRNNTSVAMTADVPPGPARRAGMGIVTLARVTGRPIVPVAIASSRHLVLNTWSRMTINLPWSRCGAAVGEPIVVPADIDAAEQERLRQLVEDRLNEATREAYAKAGVEDPFLAHKRRAAEGASPMLGTYRTLSRGLMPLAPVVLGHRERRGKEEPGRRGERLGEASRPRPDGGLVWLHAASVGETMAVTGLVQALRGRRPDLTLLLTTGTVTSARLVEQRLSREVIHQYVPLDAPAAVRRFLDHWKPDLAVLVESEIWPNLVLESAARGIPLALINARMSDRSFRGWQRRSAMARSLIGRFGLVLTQNEMLARRFTRLGASDVRISGNLKFDAPPLPYLPAELERLRAALAGRSLWLAASTHPGEEALVAKAARLIGRTRAGLLTIIVPRHPERGTAVAGELEQMGLRVAQRSLGQMPSPVDEVYLADTLGELGLLYALAPVAFVGGSLVPHGGQNPIEAVKHGAVVVTGPHWQNFHDAYKELLRRQGTRQVASAEELAEAVGRLLDDPAGLAAMGCAAREAVASLGGALERTLAALEPLLPPAEGLARAS